MSENSSGDAAEISSVEQSEELFKYVAPISGGRKLYFFTFGHEKLDLPPDAVLAQSGEASDV